MVESNSEALFRIYASALDGMSTGGPSPLMRRARFEAEELDSVDIAAPSILVDHLNSAQSGERLLTRFRLTLARWDAESLAEWIGETKPGTDRRRSLIYKLLDLDEPLVECIEKTVSPAKNDSVVISDTFEPWYGRVMGKREPFYWKHYAEYLAGEWDSESSVAALDLNTTRIVERLSDPERKERLSETS